MQKRLLDLLGLLLVGDGLLSAIDPERHCLLWEVGPKGCREFIDEFAGHPTMTRWIGVAEALAGVAIAQAQRPTLWQRARP